MDINTDNLNKLADGLEKVSDDQFDLESFQHIFDGSRFATHHPMKARQLLEDYPVTFPRVDSIRGTYEFSGPTFQIEHNCGTSGCALGWAPALVEPGKEGENWRVYCARVFGIREESDTWDYMFSSDWIDAQNTQKQTARRIRYVAKNGRPPKNWKKSVNWAGGV